MRAAIGREVSDVMTAVDTNVLVRLLTGDEPRQEAAARALFSAGPIWIAKTVLLETGWVLRSLYGFEESAIRDAFTKLLGLENVHVEDESSMAAALALKRDGYRAGHGPANPETPLRAFFHHQKG